MRTLGIVLALVVVCVTVPCRAQTPLVQARSAYQAGALDRAQRGYEAALSGGGLGPAELAETELYLGVIARATSDPAAMRAHFARAVAVDPSVQAPAELPPRGRRALEEARAASSGAITLRVAPPVVATSGPVVVRAVVERAPPGMITDVRFTLGPWTATVPESVGRVDVPEDAWPRAPGDLVVEALTTGRNVASRVQLTVSARPAPSAPTPPETVATEPVRLSPADAVERLDRQEATVVVIPIETSALEEPAVWIVVGLVIVAAVTAAVLAVTLHDRYIVGVPRVEGLSFP